MIIPMTANKVYNKKIAIITYWRVHKQR